MALYIIGVVVLAIMALGLRTIADARTTIGLNSTLTKTMDFKDDHLASDPLTFNSQVSYTNGTGANQANQHWHDNRSIAASGTDTLDLSGTSLQDAFGVDIAFIRIKVLYIKNNSTTEWLLVGGVTNGWDGSRLAPFLDTSTVLQIPPGGEILLTAPDASGFTVTAGTADLLKLAHGGPGTLALNYDIALLGVI